MVVIMSNPMGRSPIEAEQAVVGLNRGKQLQSDEAKSRAVAMVVSKTAPAAERTAAEELARYLRQIYPAEQFTIVDSLPESGRCVLVGSVKSDPSLRKYVQKDQLAVAESFVVTTRNENRRQMTILAGADSRGTLYGVYALLEKLGCGFYLSYDALPPARQEKLSFEGREMSDAPLVRERFVFNWHNFLSGCSTWNLADWKQWIVQAQKMGYNGVMVHAYGNNPMASFSFNGVKKPVGYLSTTQKGRDWSTQHVTDVRQLWGGFVFDGPVFGSEAAMVPDEERAEAAQRLMRDVFASAKERAMNVYFALDVDTVSANPQEVIETLPPEARFPITVEPRSGKLWLADPDTPEGYRYYKAQVEALMKAYPQIHCLVVWFRAGSTPWTAMKLSELPPRWQEEYGAELAKTPEAAKFWQSHNFFALAKVVKAFDRALKELGRDDVQIAVGSWGFRFLPGCDRFMPRHVKFIPLDYEVLRDRSQMGDAELRREIREVGSRRAVLPVVWAHHDDGHYVGRPYAPFADFYSRLADSGAAGFGIIHWTTRPLDLYFKSLAKQVWQSTKDQPLRMTCDEMAERSFGSESRNKMGEYWYRWVTEAPKIGRETGEWFIDRKLTDMPAAVAGNEQRMKLLDGVNEAALDPAAKDRLNYFKGLERFIVDLYRTEEAFQRARDAYKAGDFAAARQAMAECRPGEVIARYARFSSLGGVTRGEQGLVVSLNLRWLTHYVRCRQALRMESVRYRFWPTSHDRLAQSMGTFTFHFGLSHTVWECLGTKETGAPTFVVPSGVKITRPDHVSAFYEEICRSGIESDKPITIALRPVMSEGGRAKTDAALLPAGEYRLQLLMLDPSSTGPGQRVSDVALVLSDGEQWSKAKPAPRRRVSPTADRVDIFKETGRANCILERGYPVRLEAPGAVSLTLTPVRGKAVLCGAVLEPISGSEGP